MIEHRKVQFVCEEGTIKQAKNDQGWSGPPSLSRSKEHQYIRTTNITHLSPLVHYKYLFIWHVSFHITNYQFF
ncbi:hypothetical protein KDA_50650 [Dictyobacter alpinus]|uniref:Uncharacterized protein n=1 Tax=Dictyobacter alpinus TaxID=2014873 RepID=A0A402BDS0_9CHLR|nr:hypothetical protein KDA_50650 [Dictyobacter alpinus]